MAKITESLTGDDIACCELAIGHALNWWDARSRRKRSSYAKARIAELKAVQAKLSAINNHAYPYINSDAMPLDLGKEILLRTDRGTVRKTRATARRRNRAFAEGKLG